MMIKEQEMNKIDIDRFKSSCQEFFKMISADNNEYKFNVKVEDENIDIEFLVDGYCDNLFYSMAKDIIQTTKHSDEINAKILYYLFDDEINCLIDTLLEDFDLTFLTALSNEKYERKGIKNISLTIVPYNIEDIDGITIKFDENNILSLTRENIHGIRKQLEMVQEDECLVVDHKNDIYWTYGIAKKKCFNKFIMVTLGANSTWKLQIPSIDNKLAGVICQKNEIFMLPYIENLDVKRNAFKNIVQENGINANKILEIINEIKKLNIGASIIFSDKANDICTNYVKNNKYGYITEPIDAMKVTNNISAIDGAIICDWDGMCHGYGVILSFPVHTEGDMARGSRFNSIKNFIDYYNDINMDNDMETFTCGVIISDDSIINYFTKIKTKSHPNLSKKHLDFYSKM